MLASILIAAESTGGLAWRIALAFLLVIIAVALVYALVRAGRVLQKVEKLVQDLDVELVPVLRKASTTVDEVNAELDKVNDITASVAEMTERVDAATRAVENAVSTPAKKAAAFTSGVSQTVSSFFGRRGPASEEAADYAAGSDWAPGTAGAAEPGTSWGAGSSTGESGSWSVPETETASAAAKTEPVAEAPEATPAADAAANAPAEPASGEDADTEKPG